MHHPSDFTAANDPATYDDTENAVLHMGGSMAKVLRAEDRAQAHQRIAQTFTRADIDQDGQLLQLARLDPSLFIEPEAPRQFDAWKFNKSPSSATWLANAATAYAKDTIGHLFAAGVHPDDEAIFGGKCFLGYSVWMDDPDLLEQALQAGASPDHSSRANPKAIRPEDRIPVRRLASELARQIGIDMGSAGRDQILRMLACAHLLLDHGAAYKDPCPLDGGKLVHQNAISQLTCQWNQKHAPWIRDEIRPLLIKFMQRGADLNDSLGYAPAPPVLRSVWSQSFEAACLLIELGARTEDAFLAESTKWRQPPVTSLVEEARSYTTDGKADLHCARLIEAMMQRQLQVMRNRDCTAAPKADAQASSPAIPPAPAPGASPLASRRRMAV